jgi:hypothetical protein
MGMPSECASCSESVPLNECPKSERKCGHHCNHTWTHDICHWCGYSFVIEQQIEQEEKERDI